VYNVNFLGKYIINNSIIERFDTRLKIIITILFMVTLFFPIGITGLVIAMIMLFFISFIAKIPIKSYLSLFKFSIILFIILFLLNSFIVKPSTGEIYHLMFQLGSWIVYWEALDITIKVVLRIFDLMLLISILTITTSPSTLTKAISSLMKPLGYLKFPVEEISLILSTTLRFIPIIGTELKKISYAQASRGADFKNGNFLVKLKSISSLLIPLFLSSFNNADELSNSLEVRGYVLGSKKTQYYKFKITKKDILLLLIGLIFITFLWFMAFNEWIDFLGFSFNVLDFEYWFS